MRIRSLATNDKLVSAAFLLTSGLTGSDPVTSRIQYCPVLFWGVVDFGGEVSEVRGFVIRQGKLGDAEGSEDFIGYRDDSHKNAAAVTEAAYQLDGKRKGLAHDARGAKVA